MKGFFGRAGWLAVGLLLALGLGGIASIGMFVLAATLPLVMLLVARAPGGAAWAPLGGGIMFAVFGVLSLPWQACDGTSSLTVPAGSTEAVSSSCGGLHPAVWFGIAAALAAASAIAVSGSRGSSAAPRTRRPRPLRPR